MTQLNHIGQQLVLGLQAADVQIAAQQKLRNHEQKIHVVGAGATLTAAYEQLRNAAEYTEEHMLLQRAIRRYYRRLFSLRDERTIAGSGEDLIVELTQAGYLHNDSITETEAQHISQQANQYYQLYQELHRDKKITYRQADEWTYELLAVEIEWLLSGSSRLQAFTQFAHDYFKTSINADRLFETVPADFDTALYVAIHRALLKSDNAVIRLGLLKRYQQTTDSQSYVATNRQIDQLFASSTSEKLFRVIDRRGAPLRVFRHMIDEASDIEVLLDQKDSLLSNFEKQVTTDYESIYKKVNAGVIKSVIFLIITKVIIGVAVEVPYDYVVFGMIAWLPLVINLFFPPVYMVLLRATMMLPGPANTSRLVDQLDQVLYGENEVKQLTKRPRQEFGSGYNIAYGVIFVLVFGTVAYVLWKFLQFELLHLVIFFVFLSAASFLGFRLSRMIREIESIETHQNGVTLLRDFLYMPFVVVGRFISDRYAKINIVALALDMMIELPLKTILRLVRQWAAFITTKKDEL